MDYEKAYKDALKLARDYHEDKNCFEYLKGVIENIFPELAESEDDRISREIAEFILTHRIDEPNNIEDTNSWLVWLEKQGEKPQVDGFDAELNALLKKYEHLPKEEILGWLNYYVLVLGKEMDEQQ